MLHLEHGAFAEGGVQHAVAGREELLDDLVVERFLLEAREAAAGGTVDVV